jgi:hypothetical protein
VVWICTLYIPATQQRLAGRFLGLASCTQQHNSSVAFNHCTVHRQALTSSKLHDTLTVAVKAAYFTETKRQKTRLIRNFVPKLIMNTQPMHFTVQSMAVSWSCYSQKALWKQT